MEFPTHLNAIKERIAAIDPKKYAATRNYVDGALTYLSPYISRGVISTKQVFEHLLSLNLSWNDIEKLVQELAWRDYWQHVWIAKEEAIHSDLKNEQLNVVHHEIPTAITNAQTGIDAVDKGIHALHESGYMHNHMRMYVASIACNIAQSHWFTPSRWMYAHLLDGDLASNQLSWQWVAGAFSNKKYYANQENINRFFHSDQTNTFLDVEYDAFEQLPIPDVMKETQPFDLITKLPELGLPQLDPTQKTLIYNYYNLDPNWHTEEDVQRVLLIEPSLFKKYPVSEKCIDFMLNLAANIPNIVIFVEEFNLIVKQIPVELITFKEHPLNKHYRGT